MKSSERQVYHYLYPLSAAILAAISYVVAEIVIRDDTDPVLVAGLGNLFGGLLVLTIGLRQPDLTIFQDRKALRVMVLGSLSIYSLAYLFNFNAMSLVGASKTALLGQLETVFIVLLAIIFLQEPITRRRIIAGVLALSGMGLINFDPQMMSFSFGLGEFLAVLSPLGMAIGIVTLTPLFSRFNALWITGMGMLLGFVGLLAAMPFLVNNWTVSLFALGTIALLGSVRALSWASYNMGLPYLGAAQSAIIFVSFAFFTVLFQTLTAYLVPSLGLKVPDNLELAVMGGVCITAGIVLLQTEASGNDNEDGQM